MAGVSRFWLQRYQERFYTSQVKRDRLFFRATVRAYGSSKGPKAGSHASADVYKIFNK
jgi:hypothetical protein